MKFLNKDGIILGDEKGNVSPKANLTNEQALIMIMRALKKHNMPKLNSKIAVVSDIHYFPADFVSEGKAFNEYLVSDRKLLAESEAIFNETVKKIKSSNVDIVFVTGDMTKDGEKQSHQEVAALLKEIEETGKKVYVIPGNHDINNPEAVKYVGDEAIAVDTVTPEEFVDIYKEFGYDEALERDPHSLSYIVEPEKGMKLFAMDTCKYEENIGKTEPVVSGALKDETLNWIKGQIDSMKNENCIISGMMHHNLLEHFNTQSVDFSDYVVANWDGLSTELADLGMKFVFTGHSHRSDITMKETEKGNKIYYIETNSLV